MTPEQKGLSRRYLVYTGLLNLWFMEAIWLLFYRLFMNDQQVGILDSLAFAIGLFAEVPSGALADKFGRDKLVRIGQALVGMSILWQGFSSTFSQFLIGQAVMMVGVAFASGADEALFFDSLKFDKNSKHWRKLQLRASQVATIAMLVATIIGGIVYTYSPRFAIVINGLSFLAAVVAIWPVKDVIRKKRYSKLILGKEFRSHFSDIAKGFISFTRPALRSYLPLVIIVAGLFYTVEWGMLRPVFLSRFEFDAFWGSVVLSVCGLIAVIAQEYLHRHAEKVSERRAYTVISLSAIVAFLLAVPPIGNYGFFVLLILYLGARILQPFLSESINHHTSSDSRATVLSVASFFRTFAYVLVAPLIGFLNTKGELRYYLVGWAVLSIFALLYYLSHKKRDEILKIQDEGLL